LANWNIITFLFVLIFAISFCVAEEFAEIEYANNEIFAENRSQNSNTNDSSWTLEKFLGGLNNYDSDKKNHPLLKFEGISNAIAVPNTKLDFAPMKGIDITYGFLRNINDYVEYYKYDRDYRYSANSSEVENIVYFGSEQAFLGIYSTGLNLNAPINQKCESWNFGFSYENAYGYRLASDWNLYLAHRSALFFTHLDFENFLLEPFPMLKEFDETVKFGMQYSPSVKVQYSKSVSLNLSYEYSLTYRDFRIGRYAAGYIFESLAQRWIDTQEKEYLAYFGKYYPIFYFAYKNAISYLLYSQRKEQEFFPFGGAKPLRFEGYKVGIEFNF